MSRLDFDHVLIASASQLKFIAAGPGETVTIDITAMLQGDRETLCALQGFLVDLLGFVDIQLERSG